MIRRHRIGKRFEYQCACGCGVEHCIETTREGTRAEFVPHGWIYFAQQGRFKVRVFATLACLERGLSKVVTDFKDGAQ